MSTKYFASLIIDAENRDPTEKIIQGAFVAWVGGVVDAFVQLGKRDERHRTALITQGVQPADDIGVAVQIMNNPVRIHEIPEVIGWGLL